MIYFIEAVGADRIKIGFTDGTAEERLKGLKTGCPHELRVLAQTDGPPSAEAELHRLFAHLREKGEWFRAAPELRMFVWLLPRLRAGHERLDRLESRDRLYYGWLFPDSAGRTEDGRRRCALDVVRERLDALDESGRDWEPEVFYLRERVAALEQGQQTQFAVTTKLLQRVEARFRAESARSLCGDCRA